MQQLRIQTTEKKKRETFNDVAGIFTGCLVNGQKVTEDRSVMTTEDPCVTCKCNKGHLTCAKQACPTLNCPVSRIINEAGECCPHCRGESYIILIIQDKYLFLCV